MPKAFHEGLSYRVRLAALADRTNASVGNYSLPSEAQPFDLNDWRATHSHQSPSADSMTQRTTSQSYPRRCNQPIRRLLQAACLCHRVSAPIPIPAHCLTAELLVVGAALFFPENCKAVSAAR